LAGTAGAFSDPFRSTAHPPPCPPSLSAALLSALSAAHRRCGTMRALTPAAPRQRDRPLDNHIIFRWVIAFFGAIPCFFPVPPCYFGSFSRFSVLFQWLAALPPELARCCLGTKPAA